MAYTKGDLSSARFAFLATKGYAGTTNDKLLAWLNHNDGITPASSVAHTGSGTSVLTVTGTPKASGKIKLTLTAGGAAPANGVANVASSQGGATALALAATVSVFVALWGVTLHFAAGTTVIGDTYTVTLVAHPKDLNGSWIAFLAHAGYSTGTLNDRMLAYLKSFSGLAALVGPTLSDMWREYWAAGLGPS
jgi:hypothetical protein